MRGASHRCLGKYLTQHYMSHVSQPCITAFLIGCIEPDRNPATYLKGSIRHQWLRGHNYRNARHFMRRISKRLEQKDHWNVFDYYTLGKLIHYTVDAFTYAHNDTFPTELSDHRKYEAALQEHFLDFMAQDPQVDVTAAKTVMDVITSYHKDYERHKSNIHTDCHFALAACCCVITVLLVKPL